MNIGIPSLGIGAVDPLKGTDGIDNIDVPNNGIPKYGINTTNNQFTGIQDGVVNKVV